MFLHFCEKHFSWEMKNKIIKATNTPHSDWWNILSSQTRLKDLAGWKLSSLLSGGNCCEYWMYVGVLWNKFSLFISTRKKRKNYQVIHYFGDYLL